MENLIRGPRACGATLLRRTESTQVMITSCKRLASIQGWSASTRGLPRLGAPNGERGPEGARSPHSPAQPGAAPCGSERREGGPCQGRGGQSFKASGRTDGVLHWVSWVFGQKPWRLTLACKTDNCKLDWNTRIGMKAVILAGGLGTRISEETQTKPKPMIEIGGRPILWHILKIYSHYGINNFII